MVLGWTLLLGMLNRVGDVVNMYGLGSLEYSVVWNDAVSCFSNFLVKVTELVVVC